MPKIRVLEPETVSKIAAGEVIERPASVVRELVENSIDAGASRVLIEVAEGGKGLIRVTDDGSGMDREDALLAFEKHATSKISGAEDLDNINTLGFRGEALPSIASVARSVEVYTKTSTRTNVSAITNATDTTNATDATNKTNARPKPDDFAASGTHLRIEDGKVLDEKDVGCPAGTTIEVRDLFYNIPARRKYLKSARSELARIVDVVTSYAIINHHVSFELFTGKRTAFKSVRSDSWNDCLLRILGSEVARGLIPVNSESEHVKISGVVGNRTLSRSSPDWIMTYVNGRAVRSRALTRAVTEAYRTLIPTGRYPIAVVSFRVDPSQVDVNVHPAKMEVRFLKEEALAEMLTETVSKALQEIEETESSPGQMRTLQPKDAPFEEQVVQEEPETPSTTDSAGSEVQRTLSFASGASQLFAQSEQLEPDARPGGLRVLGQVLRLYIVAEGPDGLVLVDQHAAAERTRYEQLQKRHRSGSLSQELIAPVSLELSPREQLMLEDWKDVLEEMGFDIEPFGGNAYNVRSVPAIGTKLERPEVVHDVLRDLFALGKVSSGTTTRDDVLKLLACRGSIKAGHNLTWKEMQDLLRDLFACGNPKTCPHGRPTMVTISPVQLEKIFARR